MIESDEKIAAVSLCYAIAKVKSKKKGKMPIQMCKKKKEIRKIF